MRLLSYPIFSYNVIMFTIATATYVAKFPTPIFNTQQISFHTLPLKKDNQGRLMEMESIAFPGTKFKCFQVFNNLLQVETNEYPSSSPLYVDSRFLQETSTETLERIITLPSSQEILSWMEARVGLRYFWGGNWDIGIPQLLEFYPVLKNTSSEDQDDAICRGVDCSGLLYQATNGYTPRNTSGLASFGQELPIQHLPLEEIRAQLKPLDLLVWKGHVVFVRSATTLIESRIEGGVRISDFDQRYPEILDLMKKENKTLYIRRWHPDSLHQN